MEVDIRAEMLKASAPPKKGPKMKEKGPTSKAIIDAFTNSFFGTPPPKKIPKMKYVGEMIAESDISTIKSLPKQLEYMKLALVQILSSSPQ